MSRETTLRTWVVISVFLLWMGYTASAGGTIYVDGGQITLDSNDFNSPTISGHVTGGGYSIEGVQVSADNDGGSDITDSNGYYELTVLHNWSGTVIPSKSGMYFNPESMSYSSVVSDQTNQDYSEAPRPSIIFSRKIRGRYDDGYYTELSDHSKSQNLTSDDLRVGTKKDYFEYYYYTSGMRYEYVTVPKNVVIQSAYLRIKSSTAWGQGDAHGIIYGEAADNPGDFTGVKIYERSTTSTSVSWSLGYPANKWFTSPDISNIIRQITGRSGWSSGNSMVIILACKRPNVGYMCFYAYDSGWIHSTPELEITYDYPLKISGYLQTEEGAGIEGMPVTATNGGGSNTTDYDGYYELQVPPPAWTGTLKPIKAFWVFEPPELLYTDLYSDRENINFTAFAPCTISGTITDSNGTPADGVLVSGDNGGGSDSSDSNGFYELPVPYGWSGSLTPSKHWLGFEPSERVYENVTTDQTGENFTVFPPPVISGYLADANGLATDGVLVSVDEGGSSDTTDVNGYYEFSVPYGWSGTVTPTKSWWAFEPNEWTYTNVTTDQINQNYTALAPPIISGYIRDSNQEPVCDALVSTSDGTNSDLTDSNGYYEMKVPQGWSGKVVPEKTFWAFEPNEWTYTNVTTDQINQNYTGLAPPIISGYIRDSNQEPVGDALVSTSDGTNSDLTDSNGYYEMTVPQGWSGKVVPEKTFWFFEPNELAYETVTEDIPNQNFTGIRNVVISGYITNVGGKSVRYVEVKAQDVVIFATTDSNGFYQLAVPPGFSGTVTPSRAPGPPPPGPPGQPGGTFLRKFEPPYRSYSNLTADLAEQNYLMLGIRVRADGTGDYPTIRAAIGSTMEGDEVIMEPGIYTGLGNCDIIFDGRAITVRSIEPNNPAVVAATIIDPNASWFAFIFYNNEGPTSIIDGITIINGRGFYGNYQIGGIYCSRSSPTIRNCVIRNCFGDGIVLTESSAIIKNCVIRENGDLFFDYIVAGSGIHCRDSSPLISNCIISHNLECGLQSVNNYPRNLNPYPTVINCIFTGNCGFHTTPYGDVIQTSLGGGIFFVGGDLSVINCTFSGNTADIGGGICVYRPFQANTNNMTISNCIFRANDANDGPQIAITHYQSMIPPTVTVSYSDIEGGEADVYVDPCCILNWNDDNNLDIDPCFAVPGYWHTNDTPEDANDDFWVDGDYHLKSEKGRWKPSIHIGLDTKGDRFINLFDFASFAGNWQKQGGAKPADLDRSGIVDSLDLKLLLDNYLYSYAPGEWVLDGVTSGCIDAGDPSSDWTGELWPHGKRINMGAYGDTPEASISSSDAGSPADLNGDGFVGHADKVLFMDKWLCEAFLLAEDIDRNGLVNFFDFTIFANNWEGTPGQATNPNPADGERDVGIDVDLSWTAGYVAASHDVYFGKSNPPPFICNQTATTFDPGTMTKGTKYYWRIDGVNTSGKTGGKLWRFYTVSPPPTPP